VPPAAALLPQRRRPTSGRSLSSQALQSVRLKPLMPVGQPFPLLGARPRRNLAQTAAGVLFPAIGATLQGLVSFQGPV
jgi:hypothetical protein